MKLKRRKYKILVKVRNVMIIALIFVITLICIILTVQRSSSVVREKKSNAALKYLEFYPQYNLKALEIKTIKHLIAKHNSEERILNLDYFGPLKRDAPVFVVFVDEFRTTLKYLLFSLSHLTGIEDALVIFSHSRYDENVNNLVQIVNFTRVLQIFYPYTIQVYQNEFPGFTKGDCPHTINIFRSKNINCTGIRTPDINGRFRDPKESQLKHFWWWTMNKVFENLLIVKHHTGIFTFLEDDVFLIEDFIYMTIHIRKICKLINNCEFISMHSPKFGQFKFEQHIGNAFMVELTTWNVNHSSVLSFDSSVWNSIVSNYHHFCYFEDSSWARSLYYLSLNRKDGDRYKVMSSRMPRAVNTKSQNFYNEHLEEKTIDKIDNFLETQEQVKQYLTPFYLEIYANIELDDDDFMELDYDFIGGGWSDPRDKNMCSSITKNKIKKVLMEMSHEFSQYEPNDNE